MKGVENENILYAFLFFKIFKNFFTSALSKIHCLLYPLLNNSLCSGDLQVRVEILVKEVRKAQGKTLKELSFKSGISTTHINDIENNLKSPSLYVMVRLSNALQVKITELYKVKW